VIMGHVHDSMTNDVTPHRPAPDLRRPGTLTGSASRSARSTRVIAPRFMEYSGVLTGAPSYAPGSWGTVSCTLHDDGSYRVSE